MFNSTIRRSVATLGLVAGLLTAAVPASASGVPSDGQKKDNVKAVVVLIGANDYGFTAQDTQVSLGRENSIE
jgi:hypothetical protein